MLTTDINVRRKLPVINGFVMLPDGQNFLRTKLTPLDVVDLIPGTSFIRMGARGLSSMREIVITDPTSLNLKQTSSRMQARLFVVLPDFDRLDGAPSDWFKVLRDAAAAL